MEHRDGSVPVAVVTGAMRDNQKVEFTTLADMDKADVGMQTVLFIGSTASIRYMDFLFTPGDTPKNIPPEIFQTQIDSAKEELL